SAIAAKMDSALRCFSFPSKSNAFQSGRKSKRFFGAIWPAMIAWRTLFWLKNFKSRFSCPTRIHSIRSTRSARTGSVSPVNAAAITSASPALRAASVSNRGYTPFPAMIPRVSGFVTNQDYQHGKSSKAPMYVAASAAADIEFEIDRGSPRRTPLQLLPVAASFDVQLGKRFLERCLNSCDLLRSVIFFHRCFGALDGRFSCSNVDLLRFKCHVSQN